MMKQQIKLRWLLPIALALLFTLGDTVAANNGKLIFDTISFAASLVLFAVFFVALFAIVVFVLAGSGTLQLEKNAIVKTISNGASAVDRFLFSRNKQTSTAIMCIVILLCWIPWLVLFFPGIYWSDTSQELLEHFGLVTLSDHHPYSMTLILGWFADLGNSLFNSVSKGLFVLICIQSAIAIYFFSRFIWELHDSGLGRIGSLALLCFVSLFPFIPLMFCSVAKDTLSCAFFLGFALQLFLIVKSNGKELQNPRVLIAMIVCALISSLTKKTTGYVVLLCFVPLLLAYRKKESLVRSAAAAAVVFAIVFIVFPKLILPAFYVQPSGKQEAIATLIQQVAHDVTFNSDDLTSEDRSLIDDFLLVDCDEIPSRYNWQIVDPVKERGLHNDKRMGDFVKLWAKNTLKHPRGHLESWLGLVDGWITFRTDLAGTPNYMVVLTYSGWHDDGIETCTDWNDQITSGGKSAETIYRAVQSMPVLNVLFFRSTWATIVPLLTLFLLLDKSRNSRLQRLVLAMPVLASLIPLAITPVSVMGGEPTRYVFAIVCAAPLLISASCVLNQEKSSDSASGKTR